MIDAWLSSSEKMRRRRGAERREQPEVGGEAGGEHDRGLAVLPVGQLGLELVVHGS